MVYRLVVRFDHLTASSSSTRVVNHGDKLCRLIRQSSLSCADVASESTIKYKTSISEVGRVGAFVQILFFIRYGLAEECLKQEEVLDGGGQMSETTI